MFVSSRITFSCNKSRISQTLLLPQPNFVQFSKFLFMLKVYKVCQNQLAQLHPVHTSLCHPSWLDMNKKLDTSRVFKDWHNFCSFNSRLRQKKKWEFAINFDQGLASKFFEFWGKFKGNIFKVKVWNSASMIQRIFKGAFNIYVNKKRWVGGWLAKYLRLFMYGG